MKVSCLIMWLIVLAAPCHGQFVGRFIMLDAGHGGTDPGALGIDGAGYPNEEDVVLDVVLRLRGRLEAAGASVMLTRQSDAAVSLTNRRDLADSFGPDLFLSIHGNSFTEPTVGGTETYWWAAGNAEDQLLAQAVQGRMLEAFSRSDRGVKQRASPFSVPIRRRPSRS